MSYQFTETTTTTTTEPSRIDQVVIPESVQATPIQETTTTTVTTTTEELPSNKDEISELEAKMLNEKKAREQETGEVIDH